MKEMFFKSLLDLRKFGIQILNWISYCKFPFKFHWFGPWSGNILGPPEYFHWLKKFSGRIHSPKGGDWKLRKTRTFEMDVMQKLLTGKFSNLAHMIFTHGCLYQYHQLVLYGLLQIKQYCFIQGVLICKICMDRSSNKVGLLHYIVRPS